MMLRMLLVDPFMPRPVRPVIVPTMAEVIFVFGLLRFGWLKALVAVACSFTRVCSRIWKYLKSPKSTLNNPGPSIMPVEASPRLPLAGWVKTFGLNHIWAVGLEIFGFPITLGRPPNTRALEVSRQPLQLGSRNWPLCRTTIYDVSQLPSVCFSQPGRVDPKCLPVPNGSSQIAVPTKRWRERPPSLPLSRLTSQEYSGQPTMSLPRRSVTTLVWV